jgi:hypothetical protein
MFKPFTLATISCGRIWLDIQWEIQYTSVPKKTVLIKSKRKELGKERLISVVSPEPKRQKLALDEPPPGFSGPPGTFRFGPSSMKLAKRLETLEDKTLYLVDIGFGGGDNFMLEVQRWFAHHMPSVTTIPKRKPGFVFSDDNYDLWDEIKEKGDGVILGVAG